MGTASSVLGSYSASQETSQTASDSKRVYSPQEVESARFYFSSGGLIEDAYIVAAIRRYRESSTDGNLSDIEIAHLISSTG